MKKHTISVLTAIAVLSLTCPVYAAGDYQKKSQEDQMQQSGQMQQSDQMQQQSGQLGQASDIPSADQLQGMTVISQQGEEIGEIQNVKTDPQSGQISHVTISRGGVLGIGAEEVAVPLGAFNFSPDLNQATLTVDQSLLENAPQQADMSDQQFQQELQTHYGVSPEFQQDQQQRSPSDMSPQMDQQPDMQLEDSKKQQKQSPGSY